MLPITRITMFMAAMLALQAGLVRADDAAASNAAASAPEVVVPPENRSGSSMSFDVAGEAKKDAPDLFGNPIFNEKVTLDFKNADIQNVLRLVAAKTGLNILLDPDEVEGQITLHLENVQLGHALDNILRVRKLAYVVEQGDIVRIVPEARVGRAEVETTTQIIELNWRDAEDMEKTFTNFLTSHGSIKANAESQSLIITDVPPTVTKIRELISGIDRPDRQVIIEARLVDMQIGAAKTFETQWSAASTNGSRPSGTGSRTQTIGTATTNDGTGVGDVTTTNNSDISTITSSLVPGTIGGVSPVTLDGVGFKGGLGTLSFGSTLGILGDEYLLDATLTALENRQQVQVLANPRVTTLNNVVANIEIIQRVPYIQGSTAGNGGNTVLTVEFEKVGETIKVKPIITPDGHVRLDIDLLQRIFRGRQGVGDLAAPIIDDRSTKSTVIVKDKNTVVLGGLRKRQGNDSIDGVPWLHRMPLIGWAFKNKKYDQQRTELVLMVTPNIVEQALINDREKELYDQIEVEWGVPDYFNDATQSDLDRLKTPNCNPLEEHAKAE